MNKRVLTCWSEKNWFQKEVDVARSWIQKSKNKNGVIEYCDQEQEEPAVVYLMALKLQK